MPTGQHFGDTKDPSLWEQYKSGVISFLEDPLKNNAITTAWNYYTGPSASTPAPAPASGGRGYYGESGYIYLYDPSTGAVTIVASPISTSSTSVAPGTTAYNAIVQAIRSGVARPMTPDQVKAQRGAAKAAPARTTPSYTAATTSYTAPTTAPVAAPTPSSDSWTQYAPWIVLGAAGLVAVGLVATAPKHEATP
jgi:hypothetical protein